MKPWLAALAVTAVGFVTLNPAQAKAVGPHRFERPFQGYEQLQPLYPWRVPGNGDRLRLLILAHSWTTVEFAEFAKRFDCEYDLVPIWSENFLDRAWETAESQELWAQITRLLADKDYDAILVSCYGTFPARIWAAIYRECLERHAGLLLFNAGGAYTQMPQQMKKDGFLADADRRPEPPLAGMDWSGCYEEKYPVDASGRLGPMTVNDFPLGGKIKFYAKPEKCRTVIFEWSKEPYSYWAIHHGITPAGLYFPFGRVYPMADHIFALAGKALLWAADREYPVRITQVTPDSGKVPGPAAVPLTCTLANADTTDRAVTVNWEVRDENNRQLTAGEQAVTVPAGTQAMVLALGQSPAAGRHLYFRGRLLVDGRVCDWATAHAEIQFPEEDWTFTVANADRNLPETPFQAVLTLKNPAAGDLVRVNLYDSWNRLARSVEAPAAAGPTTVPVSLRDTDDLAFRLQAQWWRQDKLLGQKEVFATVQRLPQQRFFAIRSDPTASTVAGWYLSQLNKLYGINFYRTPGTPDYGNALFGMKFGVYSYNGRINGPIKPEADLAKTYDAFVKNDVLPVTPYNASLYDFGDDTGLGTGLFQSAAKTPEAKTAEEASDWDRFIGYLKTVYASPAELAENWGLPVKAFADVTRTQLLEQQKANNLVPLLDYRQYQEWLYAKHLRHMRSLVREHIPDARVTINGYGDIGLNYDSVTEAVDSLVPYYRPFHLRELRGLLGHGKSMGTVTGAYYGEQTNRRFLAFIPWETVLLGGNVVWLWGQGCISADGGFANSTYPLFESTRQLAAGPGELLAAAEWQNDGVFILSCPHSSHAQEMGVKFQVSSNSRETFAAALEELQVGYDFIACAKVVDGELLKRQAKVLFLPYAVGLEPAAQEAVRTFVQKGGIAIADFRPGTRTPHGHPLTAGGLDELFGVKAVTVAEPVGRGRLPEVAVETMVDRGAGLADGKAGGTVANAPVLVVNHPGNGTTLLLNCSLSRYRSMLSAGQGDAFTNWLAATFSGAGLKVRPYGALPAGTKVFRYRRGENRYTAIYREDVPGQPERASLSLPLPEQAWVYDVRNGGSLGQMNRLAQDVGKLEAHLLLLTPQALAPFSATAEKVQVRPGETAVFRIAVPDSREERLLRFTLRDPAGNPCLASTRLLWTVKGQLELRWACALSDPPGVYPATVTDTETGQQWSAGIQVAGEPYRESLVPVTGGAK